MTSLFQNKKDSAKSGEEVVLALLDSTDESIYLVDGDCRYILANNKYLTRSNLTDNQLAGRTYGEFHSQEEAKEFAEKVNTVFETARSISYEHKSRRDSRDFLRTLSPIVVEGKVKAVVVISKDITQRKHIEEALRESEQKFRELFENAYDLIVTIDLNGNITSANKAAFKFSGYSAEDLNRINISKLLTGAGLQSAIIRMGQIAAGETLPPFEYEFIKKDGSTAIIELSSRAIKSGGKAVGIHCIARDVTERWQAEKAAKEAAEKLSSLIKTSPQAIIGIDTLGRVEIWNPVAEKLFGWSKQEVLGRALPAVPEGHQQFFNKNMEALLSGRSLLDIETVARKKDGSIIDIRVSAAPIYDIHGELEILIAFVSNITDRKRMEQKIAESERYLKNIIESSGDAIIALDDRGNIVLFNDGAEKMFGYSREELLGKNIVENSRARFYGEIEVAKNIMRSLRESKDGRIANIEIFGKTKDGREIYTSASASLLKNEKGGFIGSLGVIKNITREKLAEEALRASEDKYRSLVESTNDLIYLVDRDCRYLFINNKLLSRFGYSIDQVINRLYSEFHSPEEAKEFAEVVNQVFETGESMQSEHRSYRDGRYFFRTLSPVKDQNGRVSAVTVVSKDITERRRMEEELRITSLYARGLIEVNLDPLVTISPDGKITDVNQATEVVTGVPRERLMGSNFSDYFTEPEKAREGYQRVISRGLVRDYPLTIYHTSGRTIDVLYNATVYRNVAGEVEGVFAAARDITERKRLEEELNNKMRELEDFYNLAVGREVKMIELKNEIASLKERLSQTQKN